MSEGSLLNELLGRPLYAYAWMKTSEEEKMQGIEYPPGAITSVEELLEQRSKGGKIYIVEKRKIGSYHLTRQKNIDCNWIDCDHPDNLQVLSLKNGQIQPRLFAFTNYWMAYAYNLKKQKRSA